MNKTPPPRLLEDSEVNERLRLQLEAAASAESGYDVNAGLARFEAGVAALDAPVSDAAPPKAAAPVAANPLALKLVAAVSGAALMIASAWGLLQHSPHSQSSNAAPVQLPSPASPPPSAAKPSAALELASPPAQQPPSASLPPSAAKPATPSSPAPPSAAAVAPARATVEPHATSTAAQRSEVSRVLHARELLRSEPEAALALLKQIERDSPRGVLREEREGLMVLALWNTGEHARAKQLAQRFLANYPNSALRERMLKLLEASP